MNESLGSSPAWDDTQVDLGLAKGGGGRCEDDVAHEGEFTASSELKFRKKRKKEKKLEGGKQKKKKQVGNKQNHRSVTQLIGLCVGGGDGFEWSETLLTA